MSRAPEPPRTTLSGARPVLDPADDWFTGIVKMQAAFGKGDPVWIAAKIEEIIRVTSGRYPK